MRTAAQTLGDAAEDVTATRLRSRGWTILGRNVHVGRAEIDLLAIDPGPPRFLVAVEVRWRGRRDYGLPEETLDHRKVGRLRAAVLALREGAALTDLPVPRLPLRIDLVAVEPEGVLRHHRAVG
jgi:putative endonuclease